MSHVAKMIATTRSLRQNLLTDWGADGPYQWGTVAAVVPGVGTAFSTVNVYLDNSSGGTGAVITTGLPFINGYNPTVGDVVLIARMAGSARTQRIVLGTLEQTIHGINKAGQVFAGNRIFSAGNLPSVAAGNGMGVSPPVIVLGSGANDVSGSVTWGTGTGPNPGAQVLVFFANVYTTTKQPPVILTPLTAVTYSLGLYVTYLGTQGDWQGFVISSVNTPAASQGNTVFGANWHVVD